MKTTVWAVLTVLAGFAAAGEAEREIEETIERIERLMAEAKELEEDGRHDRARKLRAKAEDMRARVRAFEERRRREGGDDRARMERILAGLEHGIGALDALGRRDEANHLREIAQDVRRKMKHHGERRAAAGREADIVRGWIQTMRIAMRALLGADREELAHQLEHAIHAYELGLEGRRDPEAKRIRETAPSRANQAELLLVAARILDERGHGDASERVEELGRHFAELERRRGHRSRRRHEREERETHARHVEYVEHLHRALERIERLEQRMRRLEGGLERIHESLQTLLRDLDRR